MDTNNISKEQLIIDAIGVTHQVPVGKCLDLMAKYAESELTKYKQSDSMWHEFFAKEIKKDKETIKELLDMLTRLTEQMGNEHLSEEFGEPLVEESRVLINKNKNK